MATSLLDCYSSAAFTAITSPLAASHEWDQQTTSAAKQIPQENGEMKAGKSCRKAQATGPS